MIKKVFTMVLILLIIGTSNMIHQVYQNLITQIEKPIAEINIKHKEEEVEWLTAKMTMYNAGDPNQTDDSPCIGASGNNICEILDSMQNVCAANFLSLGTIIEIKQLGSCIILDRTAKKYSDRIDWALPKDQKQKALDWGIQEINYAIK